ncbi:calcium/sodium antiporter [Hyphococcus sp.]|uniref:calcium/sodium antiporter n=1 Tax=Hyphococcus sp. TaxID=2038636 RepID=UPI003CCC3B59
MAWLSILSGLVLLTVGAEALIRGATGLARRLGLSELLIGLTLVGFGTSTPELVSSIEAALSGAPGIAVGNVVGSNIANILLILGLSAFISPIAVEPKSFRRDMPALVAATLVVIVVILTGSVGRYAGAAFLAAIGAYIIYAYRTERRAPLQPEAVRHEAEAAQTPSASAPAKALLLTVFGLALLIAGAKLLVTGSIEVALSLGVSDAVIGLTIVAIGTSLPELVTSVAAAARGKSDLALGNVVGSNLYNLLGILGATALVQPIAVPSEIIRTDIWILLLATAAMALFAWTRGKVERWEGALFTAAYIAYLGWIGVSA